MPPPIINVRTFSQNCVNVDKRLQGFGPHQQVNITSHKNIKNVYNPGLYDMTSSKIYIFFVLG